MPTLSHTLSIALLAGLCLGAPPALAEATPTDPNSLLDTRPLVKVPADGRYRVVYDISSDRIAAGISRGLYYARGLFEAFRKQGVAPSQLDVRLVMHGDAAAMLLTDDTYQLAQGDPFAVNPNAKIVQDLLDLGVSVEICNSAMKSKGWTAEDVLPGVTIVHDGYTRLIKLQNTGYAYIGGY